MSEINILIVSGIIGNTPEVKEINEKKCMNASLSVATFHAVKGKGSFWLPLRAWGYTAEYFAKDVKKGDLVFIEGELRIDSYKDKEDKDRTATYAIVHEFKICKKKDDIVKGN